MATKIYNAYDVGQEWLSVARIELGMQDARIPDAAVVSELHRLRAEHIRKNADLLNEDMNRIARVRSGRPS